MYRPEFIDYIKRVEGTVKKGDLYIPYPSAEGGTPTIGYGHKMSEEEVKTIHALTEEQVDSLLIKDLNIAKIKAIAVIGTNFWQKLSEELKEICIDFTFNLGRLGFLKFKNLIIAIKINDWPGINRNYRRYYRTSNGEIKELKHRNKEFFEFFIKPHLG